MKNLDLNNMKEAELALLLAKIQEKLNKPAAKQTSKPAAKQTSKPAIKPVIKEGARPANLPKNVSKFQVNSDDKVFYQKKGDESWYSTYEDKQGNIVEYIIKSNYIDNDYYEGIALAEDETYILENYTEKSAALIGNSKGFSREIKSLTNGKFIGVYINFEKYSGWVFSKSKIEALKNSEIGFICNEC